MCIGENVLGKISNVNSSRILYSELLAGHNQMYLKEAFHCINNISHSFSVLDYSLILNDKSSGIILLLYLVFHVYHIIT